MCGIAGAINLADPFSAPLSRAELARMTEAIVHRGPDDHGLVLEGGIALGARRLSIVDVAGGHQPMANEDGSIWGAQNGEIYNHRELRRTLAREGHVLRTQCDTEVLPHLLEREGFDMVRSLRGKFAIAVWDARRGRGLIA